MASLTSVFPTVTSTAYPTDPQLDGPSLGTISAAHFSPAGPAVFVSLDGVNDHARLDPAAGLVSVTTSKGFYRRAWVRLAVAGAANVQLTHEGN